jgi:hypothetical protein
VFLLSPIRATSPARGSLEVFVTSWRATPCYLSATAYSVYSQQIFICWRPFLHPQPEDASCCGDRDPPNIGQDDYRSDFGLNTRYIGLINTAS